MEIKCIPFLLFVALCTKNISSANVRGNVSEVHESLFTIDASQPMDQMKPTSTASAESHTINLFLPENSQIPTKETKISTDMHVKNQQFVAEKQKINAFNAMKKHQRIINYADNKTLLNTNDTKDNHKKQAWQIPSPLSPLATSDPKTTNSSKRQTEYNLESEFVPSQELGTYDNTEGFIPHAMHEPKSIYTPPPYQPKAINHDPTYGYSLGETRLPASALKGLESFEHDLDNLKVKYPELNDLVSNYPIMEQIVKQKLAEKFRHTYYAKHNLNADDDKYRINYNSAEQNHDYDSNYKNTWTSNEHTRDQKKNNFPERPYLFDSEKSRWSSTKINFNQDASTVETPYTISAGEFYKEPKFPITEYAGFDSSRNISSIELKDVPHIVGKPKLPVSPWKKVLHLVTTLLPVGILISALTPNVINIANVADKNYPIRHRSLDEREDISEPIKSLLNILNLKGKEKYNDEDPDCEDRAFCEASVRGKEESASTMEKIFWYLAQSTPDNMGEAVGMKKIFKAVKSGNCSEFICKKKQENRTKVSDTKKSIANKGEVDQKLNKTATYRRIKRTHKNRSHFYL